MIKKVKMVWLPWLKGSSIATRLIALMLLFMLVLALGVVGWSDQQARATVSRQQKDSLLRVTEDLSGRIDDRINSDLNRLKDLALSTITLSFFSAQGTPTSQDKQVSNYYYFLFLSQNTNFESLNILDRNRKVLYSTESLDGQQMDQVEPQLGRALLDQAANSPVPLTSQVWFSAISQRPNLYYLAPVVQPNSNATVGYLVLRVSAVQFNDLARAENDRFGPGSFVTVFDKNHTVIGDGREGRSGGTDASAYHYLYKGLQGNNYPTAPQPANDIARSGQSGVVDYNDPQSGASYFLGYLVSPQTGWEVRQYVPAALINTPINNMTLASALGSLLVMVLAGLALAEVVRRLLRPLYRLQTPLIKLAQGNLAEWKMPTQDDGGREITQIAAAFETMAYSLRELVLQVKEATRVVVAAASQVEVTSQEQLSNANQQGHYNQQVVESMRELIYAAQQLNEAGRQVASSASLTFAQAGRLFNLDQQALTEVEAARQQVQNGLAKISQLGAMVEVIANHTDSLKRTTGEIGAVLFLLKDVANEIHLLSLNAAIEAAGAGVHGDRFNVVALEVRSLARRSEQAVAQVQQMIRNIQEVTGEVVTSVESGTQQARQVSQEVAQIEGSMGRVYTIIESLNSESSELVQASNASAAAAEQIAAITEQQTKASNQVFQLLQEVQSLLDQLIVSQEQALTVSSELNQRSADLSHNVSQFKL